MPRRMFNTAVVRSSSFLKMPLTSQALYFNLGMDADDDGIVDAFATIRMLGCGTDDLKILVAKGYILPLDDDMLLWIVHFNVNNTIRADRIKPSMHRDLLLSLRPNALPVPDKGMSPEMRAELEVQTRGMRD